jgi:hypothetical protein
VAGRFQSADDHLGEFPGGCGFGKRGGHGVAVFIDAGLKTSIV